ncbi:MAG: Uma2 family endonuclease [Planctomycetales bacterium]|nr:Uma2 family endonuclease [Planctomycetales bacterium]
MSTTLLEPQTLFGRDWNGAVMTPEEYDSIREYDDNYRYELIHGVVIVSPIPGPKEAGPNEFLGYLLVKYQMEHSSGRSLDLTLAEQYVRTLDSRRRADRLIWTGLGRKPRVKHDLPKIAIEFVSAGRRNRRRDYIEKRDEYLALGLAEYWIIDRFHRIMTVCRAGQPDVVVPESEVYRTPLLPGFELPLSRLLTLADELDDEPDED